MLSDAGGRRRLKQGLTGADRREERMVELEKVVIVGGGVGGCAVALALRGVGMQVKIHEKYNDFRVEPPVFPSGPTPSSGCSNLVLIKRGYSGSDVRWSGRTSTRKPAS